MLVNGDLHLVLTCRNERSEYFCIWLNEHPNTAICYNITLVTYRFKKFYIYVRVFHQCIVGMQTNFEHICFCCCCCLAYPTTSCIAGATRFAALKWTLLNPMCRIVLLIRHWINSMALKSHRGVSPPNHLGSFSPQTQLVSQLRQKLRKNMRDCLHYLHKTCMKS